MLCLTKKEMHTVTLIKIFLKSVNVKQILFASFCQHFIGSFILEISFQKISINVNKTFFKPDGVNLQNHKNIVSAIPVSFSIKRSSETKINGPIASQIIML